MILINLNTREMIWCAYHVKICSDFGATSSDVFKHAVGILHSTYGSSEQQRA